MAEQEGKTVWFIQVWRAPVGDDAGKWLAGAGLAFCYTDITAAFREFLALKEQGRAAVRLVEERWRVLAK